MADRGRDADARQADQQTPGLRLRDLQQRGHGGESVRGPLPRDQQQDGGVQEGAAQGGHAAGQPGQGQVPDPVAGGPADHGALPPPPAALLPLPPPSCDRPRPPAPPPSCPPQLQLGLPVGSWAAVGASSGSAPGHGPPPDSRHVELLAS